MYHERQQLQRCLLHTLNNLLQRQAYTKQILDEVCDSIQATRTRLLGNYDANVLAAALELHGLEVKWHDARDKELSDLTVLLARYSTKKQPSPAPQQPQQQCSKDNQHSRQQQEVGYEVQHGQQQLGEPMPQQQSQQQQEQQQEEQQQQQQPAQQELVGLILNLPGKGLLASVLGGRHWLAIKWIDGAWWNLDSNLSKPVSFAQQGPGGDADGHEGAAALVSYLKQQLGAGGHLLMVWTKGGPSDAAAA